MYMYLDTYNRIISFQCAGHPYGKYLASGAMDSTMVLWIITGSRNAYKRCTNESGMGITSLEWDPRGHDIELGEQLLFTDLEG